LRGFIHLTFVQVHPSFAAAANQPGSDLALDRDFSFVYILVIAIQPW